jgi:alcohol dehydrogenase (cytochrome c)
MRTRLAPAGLGCAARGRGDPGRLRGLRPTAQGLPADGSRWLTFGGDYANQRHSPLTQITPDNVSRLKQLWTFQTATLGNFETTSLLRDNVLYVTGPQNLAWAIDARTGRQIWRYRRELPPIRRRAVVWVNRGFGVRRQVVHDDARRASDRPRHQTGAVVWDATLDDYKTGHSSTIAPLVVKDR